MTVQGGSIDRPNLALYSDRPMFNTKAVVQQTGVPAPTLRAWERRYTLLSPERADNTYRLYTERDIVMIRWLKERVDSGMSISQAIALFRHKNDENQQHHSVIHPNDRELIEMQETNPLYDNQPSETNSDPDVVLLRNEHVSSSGVHDWRRAEMHHTQSAFPTVYSMRLVRERLVEAFNQLDESIANMIMGSMLAIYPLEQVCTELIAPTMWQIGQLWVDGTITVSVEHFASNFFRELLTNLFHVAPSVTSGPIAIVCCAPGEPHELAPLMLSLFLRRSGVRVVYLGQNIEVEGLLQTVQKLAPALLCVSLTMPSYLSAVIGLAHRVEALLEPRPVFAFGGQVFAHNAQVISQIPGVYLTGDLKSVVAQLRDIIVQQAENKS